jgi:putative zinc finger/helix-turn-helix YgiT family protein
MKKKNGKLVQTKPFPWRCRNCGEHSVRQEIISYSTNIDYDGRTYPVVVDGLKTPKCQACGKVFPDGEANRQITQAFRLQAKLLMPQQIRNNRETLQLTQKQLAKYVGLAEETISRWETGSQIQQRSLDNLLRLFFGFQQARQALMDENTLSMLGTSGLIALPLNDQNADIVYCFIENSVPNECTRLQALDPSAGSVLTIPPR